MPPTELWMPLTRFRMPEWNKLKTFHDIHNGPESQELEFMLLLWAVTVQILNFALFAKVVKNDLE
jgi:hypothetical protein